jgi:GMP synthase-like glutamine amidotransferase
MRVGILETGRPPAGLDRRFGDYPAMLAELLGPAFETMRYDAVAGELPRPNAQPAWLITGSAAGVYENLPWIPPLEDFLRAARGKAKLVGICFGHQLMAQAFGGRVEKSARGWGAGLQTYRLLARAPWMDDVGAFAIPVSHQDQVVEAPPGAQVLAANDFSPFGLLDHEGGGAISFQGHPEFDPAYARALIEVRRDRLPDPDAHLASLDAPNDRARVAEWIRRFLTS